MFSLMMHNSVQFYLIQAGSPAPKSRSGYCNKREILIQGV